MQHRESVAVTDRGPTAGTGGFAGSRAGAMFRCPRCQEEYPLRFLVLRWSEWGQICRCPTGGDLDLTCPVFNAEPQHAMAER